MNVHYGIENLSPIKNAVVTSGTFDGVHNGHKTILSRLIQIAKNTKGETVVITFWPHPRYILSKPASDLKLLSTLDEKISLLRNAGLDHLIVIPFTKEFSLLSSQDFIDTIIVNGIQTSKLVIGYDHKFGRNREGGFEYLKANQKRFSFDIEEISRHDIDDSAVSSTQIRSALFKGQAALANNLLGYPYSLTGKVILGEQLGRKIGFPTANVKIEDDYKLIPQDGVYAVKIEFNNQNYLGMLNIGYRPTVNGKTRSIEVNIFDFNTEIYNQSITIYFIEEIRKEKKFNDIHALKDQLLEDQKIALKILNHD